MKQQVKQPIGNESVSFPSYYHTGRPLTSTDLHQSLKKQFTSGSLGQKPSSIKPEVPRPIFYNWPESSHYAKQMLMPKATHDRQQKKFQNKIYGGIDNGGQGDKKQEVIDIDEQQQMSRKGGERQMIGDRIMVKQNIKIKQIPQQYKLPSASSNRPSVNINGNSGNLSKFNLIHNYGEQSRVNQDWNRIAPSSSQKPLSKERKQGNQPQTAVSPSLRQVLQQKNEQQTQKSLPSLPIKYPNLQQANYYSKLYPSPNTMNYSGVFPVQQFPTNPSINFPQLINSPHYPMLNNPSAMLWNQQPAYPAYNQQNNHSYLYGLLDNTTGLGNNNDPTINSNSNNKNYSKNNSNSNNHNHNNNLNKNHTPIIKDTIYSKEPQLILQNSLCNNLLNQQKLTEEQLRNKAYFKNQSLAKEHEKKYTSAKINQKKSNPSVIVLDSDEQQDHPYNKSNLNHEKDLRQSENKVFNNSQIPHHPAYLTHPTYTYPTSNLPKATPTANQYPSSTYQLPYIHTQQLFTPQSQNSYSPVQIVRKYNQYLSQKNSQNSKQYKQPQYKFTHLEKKKQIYKQRNQHHHEMKTISDDKHRLMLERFQDISKIKEMFLENHNDAKARMKYNSMYEGSILNHNDIKNLNYLSPETINLYNQQKNLNINGYLKIDMLQNNFKNVRDIKDSQSINSISAARKEERLQSVNKLKKRNQQQMNGQNMQNANNHSQKPVTKNHQNSSSYPYTDNEIQGTDHVKRQAQKAFLKTRTRISSQLGYTKQSNSLQVEKKPSKKQRHQSENDFDKSVIINFSSQVSTKIQNLSFQQSSDEKQKPTEYIFEWTPRLKKLRDLSKKRDYDSVIIVGPDFQADIPRFMTDEQELRVFKAIRRRGLLERMYKHSSQISLSS